MNLRHLVVSRGVPVVGMGLTAMTPAWQPTPASKLSAALFEYDATAPLDVKESGVERRQGVPVRNITYANASGGRTGACLVVPTSAGPHAAILYVHWYEPESPDSNRTQFLSEAVDNAKLDVVSLLIDTMWSDPAWFETRRQSDDYDSSVRQVRELRRAIDLVLSQPSVDPQRSAYVGHDFGAMYGAVVAGLETRIKAYALLAGTSAFSDWFLLSPKLEGATRQAFIDRLSPLDPVRYVGRAAPSTLLFQFGTSDRFVPKEKAEEFFRAASEPKALRWYEAGHGLNHEAVRDRQQWLKGELGLRTEKP